MRMLLRSFALSLLAWVFLPLSIHAQTLSLVTDVGYIQVSGNPAQNVGVSGGPTVGVDHPNPAQGDFTFILTTPAFVTMLNTFLSSLATDRQVTIQYMNSTAGCFTVQTIVGVELY